MEGGRWRIIEVYARKEKLERILGELERWAEERERMLMMVGEDFNARTETEGSGIGKVHNWREGDEEGKRSKDKNINKEEMVVGVLEEKGKSLMVRREKTKRKNALLQEE